MSLEWSPADDLYFTLENCTTDDEIYEMEALYKHKTWN